MTTVSSKNLSQSLGGYGESAKGLYLKLFHEQVGNEGTDGGAHGSIMYLFKILTLEEEVFLKQNSRRVTMFWMDMLVL